MGKVEEIIQAVISDQGIVISPEDLKERTEFLREYLKVFDELEPKDYFPSSDDTRKMIGTMVDKNRGDLTDKQVAMQKKALEEIYIEGKAPAEAMGITPQMAQAIYAEADRLYKSGKYQDALGIFYLLEKVLPDVPEFAFGIAASYHMLNKLDEAIAWYLKCAYYDKGSPLPYFHLADCLLKKKNYAGAIGALNGVLTRAKGDPKYDKICGKVKLMIEDSKKRLEAELA